MYESARRDWIKSKRNVFRTLNSIASVVVIATLAASIKWPNLGWTCGFMAGIAVAMALLARQIPPSYVENYLLGAFGEQRTGAELARLLDHSWVVITDALSAYLKNNDIKHANFDHIVVGPPGVFIVDSKNLYGVAETRGDHLRVTNPDGKSVNYGDRLASSIRGQATDVNKLVRERTGKSVWVAGVIALWAEYPQKSAEGKRMHYVHGESLVEWMLQQRGRLSHAEVVDIAECLQPGRRRRHD